MRMGVQLTNDYNPYQVVRITSLVISSGNLDVVWLRTYCTQKAFKRVSTYCFVLFLIDKNS